MSGSPRGRYCEAGMSRVIRILAFTDTHEDRVAAKSIVALARREKPDVIVSADDVSYFGER